MSSKVDTLLSVSQGLSGWRLLRQAVRKMIMQLGRTIETPGCARAGRGPVAGLADARLSCQPAAVRLAHGAAGCPQSSRMAGHALCCAACS